jgi:RNA polymerase sigma-70 factor (ECF subfamily)
VNQVLQIVPTAREYDESALLERARSGDNEAVDQLLRRYLKDVYAVANRLLGDRDQAEDAAQDALVNALNGLKRFRGEASFRTWLMRITVNSARSIGRRKTRRREVSLEIVSDAPAEADDAATLATRHDEAARAQAALEKLPEKQRMAVGLRVNQGLSYQEIGAVLNCTEGAARVNYHLGVKRLRELVK